MLRIEHYKVVLYTLTSLVKDFCLESLQKVSQCEQDRVESVVRGRTTPPHPPPPHASCMTYITFVTVYSSCYYSNYYFNKNRESLGQQNCAGF